MPRWDLGVFLVAAAAFAVGAAPWITWYDSAELATAAWQLAVSHPPGQPLHAILGKAVTLVPFGSITFKTNLCSALGGAIGVAGTGALGRAMLDALVPTASRRARLFATIAPAVAIGMAASLMGQSTRTEVYAPAFALTAWGDVFAIRSIVGREAADGRKLAAAAFLAGLGASIHPAAGIAIVFCAGWMVLFVAPRTILRWRVLVAAVLSTALGILVLAYLPARTGPDVIPTWQTLRDWPSFKAYALGEAYRINAQGGLAALSAMGLALRSVVLRTGIVVAALFLVSIGWLGTTRVRFAIGVLGATVLPVVLLSVSPFEEENPDLQGYLLPVFALLLASTAPLLYALVAERVATAVATFALVVAAIVGFHRSEWRTGYVLPDLWVDQAMGEPPPHAFVVAESDHVVFSFSYAQIAEGARPDCGFITGGFAHLQRHLDEVASRRPFPQPVVPESTGEYRQTIVKGILKSLKGKAPRIVERAVWDAQGTRSVGIQFTMDAPPGVGDRRLPMRIERELRRGGRAYADGSDRVVWRIRYERGQGFWGRSRFRAGVRELLEGLHGAVIPARTRAALLTFEDDAPSHPYALTPMMTRPWIADERLLRTELARLATRAGRPDLGLPLLEHNDATKEDPEAILLYCELRMEGARACYDRVRRERPRLAPLCDVGMGRVLIREGKLDEAEQSIKRGKDTGDTWAVSFAGSVEVELSNARLTASPATAAPTAP